MRLLHVAVGEVGGKLEVAGDVLRVCAEGTSLCLQQETDNVLSTTDDDVRDLSHGVDDK